MADDDSFDSMKAGERISNMWMDLAGKIAAVLPSLIYDEKDPALAIKWATCAEACFWKATVVIRVVCFPIVVTHGVHR